MEIGNFPTGSRSGPTVPYNPSDATPASYHTPEVWAVPLSLATTRGISIDFSSPVTEMFQFTGWPSSAYVFSAGSRGMTRAGLPHSETVGSKVA